MPCWRCKGPKSAEVLDALGLPTDMDYMGYAGRGVRRRVRASAAAPATPASTATSCCRPGTAPAWCSTPWWRPCGPAGGEPAGLGARDTLRTEMGYPLHGHELSLDISPLQARCGWAIGWKKDAFWGRDALLAEKEAGPARVLRGLKAVGRGVLRADLAVLDGDTRIGTTTSGTFSPSLKVGIALALIDTSPRHRRRATGERGRARPRRRMRSGQAAVRSPAHPLRRGK